jgi:hypothetical protein
LQELAQHASSGAHSGGVARLASGPQLLGDFIAGARHVVDFAP